MVKRECPNCNMTWFSSDTSNLWECNICKAILPIHLNDYNTNAEPIDYNSNEKPKNRMKRRPFIKEFNL